MKYPGSVPSKASYNNIDNLQGFSQPFSTDTVTNFLRFFSHYDKITHRRDIIMIHNPKHPGRMVKSLLLDPLNLSVTKAAKLLKVSRPTLSKLINGRMNISPEMAIRLSIVFNTSEKLWIDLQAGYDLWLASKKRRQLHLKPFLPPSRIQVA